MISLGCLRQALYLTLALMFLGSASLRAQTELRIVVNFGDIQGESVDPNHVNWVEASSFTDGFSRPPVSGAVPVTSQIKITKAIDRATTKLREALLKGTHLPDVTIEFVNNANGFVSTRIVLREVLITDVRLNTEQPPASRESVELFYDDIAMTYYLQNPDGTVGGTVAFHWRRGYGFMP